MINFNVSLNEKILQDILVPINWTSQNFKSEAKINDKQLTISTYELKKVDNLGKLCVLFKIHKRLSIIPDRPVISNYETPMERGVSVFVLSPEACDAKREIVH